MKRYATVTETVIYRVEFDAPEGADDDTLDELAQDKWGLNPARKPVDYLVEFEVEA